MKESAQIGLSYVRSHTRSWAIASGLRGEGDPCPRAGGCDPEGRAVSGRHDGDRLVSLSGGRPVKSTVAMTGEVTLQGKVLPIGGVSRSCWRRIEPG